MFKSLSKFEEDDVDFDITPHINQPLILPKRKFVNVSQVVSKEPHAIRIMHWNVLANSLCSPKAFPHVIDNRVLEEEFRFKLIQQEIHMYNPDILCVVEMDCHERLSEKLKGRYACKFVQKNYPEDEVKNGRRDGCALFYDKDRFDLLSSQPLYYDKTKQAQIALYVTLKDLHSKKTFHVLSTHLKAKIGHESRREAQVKKLHAFIQQNNEKKHPCIITGDFNEIPSEKAIRYMTQSYTSIYPTTTMAITTYKKRDHESKRMIDYMFHTSNVKVAGYYQLPLPEELEYRLPTFNYP
eukprot:CAMPEP_0117428646 /NCGR_PEP_ID=MMETSP0758-20121206/8306_1 /TAXON_ID=63605 /ORGANISM="Percolomonas cosmopolitus, Strain AE-1 (ATCC 50343)" /LENGTH=295 /DNA_ID=CAMNT_0005215115 /DNA_START=11 /DNA_END=894 /DNA_ORIENTATION=-